VKTNVESAAPSAYWSVIRTCSGSWAGRVDQSLTVRDFAPFKFSRERESPRGVPAPSDRGRLDELACRLLAQDGGDARGGAMADELATGAGTKGREVIARAGIRGGMMVASTGNDQIKWEWSRGLCRP
jgi:hypothetical protein